MTSTHPPYPFSADSESLREEAALWFARMRGPNANRNRAEFEAWLARDERHRRTYHRITETFSLGGDICGGSPEDFSPSVSQPNLFSPRPAHAALSAVAALLIVACTTVLLLLLPQHEPSITQTAVATGQPGASRFITRHGEIRTFRLPDGSTATLDTDSLLTLSYSTTSRMLRLERGRARFDVAHESRPFVVAAGEGTVTARGTLFDVRLLPGRIVQVRLIRGAVDVAIPAGPKEAATDKQVARMAPGEELAFTDSAFARAVSDASEYDLNWPGRFADYDGAPLAQVIADANRHSSVQIRLGDQRLNERRVSGIFRIDEPDRLAVKLAATFDLTVDRNNPAEIVLRERQDRGSKKISPGP